jgi:hypothetical protein
MKRSINTADSAWTIRDPVDFDPTIQRQKQLDAEQQALVFNTGSPPVPFIQTNRFGASNGDFGEDRSAIRRLTSPLLGIIAR